MLAETSERSYKGALGLCKKRNITITFVITVVIIVIILIITGVIIVII